MDEVITFPPPERQVEPTHWGCRLPCSLALENGPGTCEGCPDHEPPPEAA